MTGAARGSLSVKNKVRRVAVPPTSQIQDEHVEESIPFGNKDSQTWIRPENELNTGTTRGMQLHHS